MTFKGEGQVCSPERDIPVEMSTRILADRRGFAHLARGAIGLDGVMTVARSQSHCISRDMDISRQFMIQLNFNRLVFIIQVVRL